MSATRATPGPWVVRRPDPTAEEYEDCEFAVEHPRDGKPPLPIAFVADRALSCMSDGNAKLIAAAPGLADALEAMLASVGSVAGGDYDACALAAAVREARAALRAAGRLP